MVTGTPNNLSCSCPTPPPPTPPQTPNPLSTSHITFSDSVSMRRYDDSSRCVCVCVCAQCDQPHCRGSAAWKEGRVSNCTRFKAPAVVGGGREGLLRRCPCKHNNLAAAGQRGEGLFVRGPGSLSIRDVT